MLSMWSMWSMWYEVYVLNSKLLSGIVMLKGLIAEIQDSQGLSVVWLSQCPLRRYDSR